VLQLIERGDTFVLRQSMGRNSLCEAASFVFLTAATGAGIIAADLGHAGSPFFNPGNHRDPVGNGKIRIHFTPLFAANSGAG
jgi:hypothetical protein